MSSNFVGSEDEISKANSRKNIHEAPQTIISLWTFWVVKDCWQLREIFASTLRHSDFNIFFIEIRHYKDFRFWGLSLIRLPISRK